MKMRKQRIMRIKPTERFIKTIKVNGEHWWIYGTYSQIPIKDKYIFDSYAIETDIDAERIAENIAPNDEALLEAISDYRANK